MKICDWIAISVSIQILSRQDLFEKLYINKYFVLPLVKIIEAAFKFWESNREKDLSIRSF